MSDKCPKCIRCGTMFGVGRLSGLCTVCADTEVHVLRQQRDALLGAAKVLVFCSKQSHTALEEVEAVQQADAAIAAVEKEQLR